MLLSLLVTIQEWQKILGIKFEKKVQMFFDFKEFVPQNQILAHTVSVLKCLTMPLECDACVYVGACDKELTVVSNEKSSQKWDLTFQPLT